MKYKVGSVVQLNQGNTKDFWVVSDIHEERSYRVLKLRHQDELNCAGSWFPEEGVHEAEISHQDRALILNEFSHTRRGQELIKELM